MKIVTYDEFIRMPAGTIFAPYEPCVFKDHFEIKTDTGWEDGSEYYFNGTMPLEPCPVGDEYAWGNMMGLGKVETEMCTYDGSNADYSKDELFAIFEPDEVSRLIKSLLWALNGCPGDWEDFEKNSFYIAKLAEDDNFNDLYE